MRWDRAIIVAKKDIAEFRRNRYILASIMIMPMMVAIVLPAIYSMPLRLHVEGRTDPIDLEFGIIQEIEDVTVANATLYGVRFENVTLTDCVIQNSVFYRSTIVRSVVNGSQVTECDVRDSIVTKCNLENLTAESGNTLIGSSFIGEDEELEMLKEFLFSMLFLLLVLIPVMIPTVTASYSFVGEKINRSLEPLLATPASDLELLMGKSGSIFAITMVTTVASFALCVISVNLLTEPYLGYYPLPDLYLVLVVLLLAPGMCLMSIFSNVLVSSRVSDVRVSQQVGGMVVLPVVGFFVITLAGLVGSGIGPLLAFSGVVFAVDGAILWLSLRVFRREEILVQWK